MFLPLPGIRSLKGVPGGDLGDLVSSDYEATAAALDAAFDASTFDGRLGLVGTGASDAVLHLSDGTSWLSTGVVALGDWSSPPDGTFDQQTGVDDNGTIWQWNAAASEWIHGQIDGVRVTVSTTVSIVEEDPAAAGWTEDIATGGAADYDTTVADRIAIRSGSSSGRTKVEIGTAPTDPDIVGFLITNARATGVTAGANSIDVLAPFDDGGTNRKWGLNTTFTESATNWIMDADTPEDTGIAFGTATRIEGWLNRSTGVAVIWADRDAQPIRFTSVTGTTTGVTVRGYAAANHVSSQATFESSALYVFEGSPA